MMRRALPLLLSLLLVPPSAAAQGRTPSIDDLLNLRSAGGAQVSPDAKQVAYVVTSTDWKADAFTGQVWVANATTGERRQLTRHDKGASLPKWSPDGQWLAFLSPREEDKAQLFVMRADGGEPVRVTRSESGITGYQWSANGAAIAYVAPDPDNAAKKGRVARFGAYDVIRRDYQFVHLYTIDVAAALVAPQAGRKRTTGSAFSVGRFDWSPDGTRIAFDATINPDLVQGTTSDVYVLTLATDSVRKVVSAPGPDDGPLWSPDGTQIAFSSQMGQTPSFARNNRIAIVPASGGTPRSITDAVDENVAPIRWTARGLYFSAAQKTAQHLFVVDPATSRVTRVSGPDQGVISGASVTADGESAAFTVGSPTALGEVAISRIAPWAPRVLTTMSSQIAGWTLGTREVIQWTSKDGTIVEGVLIKPANFDPSRTYPLLCVIHGGPTGTDRAVLPDARYYPVDLWAARGALVLKVNYRGSAGYGEKFRMLNVRNLGVGDAWDVLSGVDYLIGKGWVDPSKVASMGWSQGGYISAFLTTSTTRFAAISVGAGISNWATYYFSTDITPFTINYLGTDPAMDPAIYAKTSPMTYVKQAKTPTLIQHGELDRRVPIANAYELRQGLEDRGVPVEMVVYKGFGHGITKPKSQRAVMEHNFGWFNHWIWGDPMPDFVSPAAGPAPVDSTAGRP